MLVIVLLDKEVDACRLLKMKCGLTCARSAFISISAVCSAVLLHVAAPAAHGESGK